MPYKDRAKQNAFNKERCARRRQEWIGRLGGKCVECSDVGQLRFDHIDPSKKTDHRIWSWSDERIAQELKKCQLLCVECHKKKTSAENTKPLIHGTVAGYRTKRCRCEKCRSAHRKHQEEWRLRRSSTVERPAHNGEVVGSIPTAATKDPPAAWTDDSKSLRYGSTP